MSNEKEHVLISSVNITKEQWEEVMAMYEKSKSGENKYFTQSITIVDDPGISVETKTLHVFSDYDDFVVAYDPEDAIKIWNEITEGDYHTDVWGDETDWEQYDDDEIVGLVSDNIGENDVPKGARIEPIDEYTWMVYATAKEWVEYNGRGYLYYNEEIADD